MDVLRKLLGQEQGQQSHSKCYRCKKSLSEITGGLYTGADFFSMFERSPYPCKSCGTIFCVDCMAVLRPRGTCPKCGGNLGW